MARAKSPALPVPQSTAEALVLADRFAARDAELQGHGAKLAAEIASLKAAAAARMLPIAAELKSIVKQLQPWWAARHEELTDGKRRSIELGNCQIGYRLSSPKVSFANGTDGDAAATLQAAELAELLRTEISVDKPAILKLFAEHMPQGLGDNLVARLRGLGFDVAQKDEFFVQPIAPPAPVAA